VSTSSLDTSDFIWERFTFTGPVNLDPDKKYWIVLHGDFALSDTNYVQWRLDSSSGFADGKASYYDTAWNTSGTDDMMFRLVEEPGGDNYDISSGGNLQIASGETTMHYYSSIKDLTYLCEARVLIDYTITVTEALAWNSDSSQAFNDSDTLRWAGEEEPSSILFEIQTSEDNVTWSDWETLISSDYYMRYYRLRLTVTNEDPATITVVSNLTIKSDLPDIDEKGSSEVTVAASGKAITFVKTFHETPLVAIDILDGLGFVSKITSLSITGCTVTLYELDGTKATGKFKYHIHGI